MNTSRPGLPSRKNTCFCSLLVVFVLQLPFERATAAVRGMEGFAVEVATVGKVSQSTLNGLQVTGVPFSTEGRGCKMVGIWYDAWQRAIRNYKVCGSRVTREGSVAHLPKGQATDGMVSNTMKGAVMRGESSTKFEEFEIRATRIAAPDGGVSCATELVITVHGLLSFYGAQEACR